MADTQEDDLPQATALNSVDFLRIVADLAGTPVSKVLSRANLATYLNTLYEPIGGGGTGWQTVTETWTRTGNHTFTVATDLTLKYHKGTKVRYKDGGAFEYGVIGAATYSSPNTTITLITNTDYAMAAATITDTAISYQANPQGFPHLFNYLATLGGFATDPANAIYRWSARGTLCRIRFRQPSNGDGTGFTNFTISLPVTAKTIANMAWDGYGFGVDNNATLTTTVRLSISSAGTIMTAFPNGSGTSVWTNANNKRISTGDIEYEF